ncbi:MAG: SPOR domain-containing protein [Desulfuromonadaceae bacterium]|nr:SPOR domain-containing protein [Desulfuromonadaceae bacterium]MDD5105119.1 SPOR domain-containing protein [Desulfuromonadaceae bacterium]
MRLLRLLVSGLLFIALNLPQFLPAQMSDDGMMEEASQHFKDRNGYFASTWLERLLKTYPSTRHRRDALLMLAKSYSMTQRDEKAAMSVLLLLKEFPEESTTLDNELKLLINTSSLSTEIAAPTALPVQLPAVPDPISPDIVPESIPETAQPTDIMRKHEVSPPAAPLPPQVTEALPSIMPTTEKRVHYSLGTGTGLSRNTLDSILTKLAADGIKPDVAYTMRETEVFRLLVACFPERKQAEHKRAEIALRSKHAFIARNNNSFCVVAGSLMSEESAVKEVQRVARKGVTGVKIAKATVPLKVWQVTFGRYASVQEAEQAAQSLSKNGVEVRVITGGD